MTPPLSQETTVPQGNTASKRSAKDFIFGKEIGEGSFSTVYLAKDIHTHKEYAIKVCEKRHIVREKKVEYVKREKEVLNLLSDSISYFVRLYCTFQDKERLYFVLTYAKNGEMLQCINKVGSFDLPCTIFYTAELILALEVLNRKGIIHRDLKPENILLDEKMHILITDFGSAKVVNENKQNEGVEKEESEKRRRNSFVGTAHYVSPEILQDIPASCSSDLWALGCIIFQMIAGVPPFRAGSEYLIFQKILKLDFTYPEGFTESAKDLITRLLVLDPKSRLGAADETPYSSLREHSLFSGVNWTNLGSPPKLCPYLPDGDSSVLRSRYDNLEPGLDDKKVSKLQLESICSGSMPLSKETTVTSKERKGIADVAPLEKSQRLETQKQSKWHQFVEGNLILKQGLLDKRKGLRARRRMFMLTLGPHLYYVDPSAMVLKGEIPWTPELRVEAKNFKTFFVHTPNRTYYLEDPEGYALNWFKAIEEVHQFLFPQNLTSN